MKRRKVDTSHVKAASGPDGTTFVVKCTHCGSESTIALPIGVSVWCATIEGFIKAHKHCKPREATA